MLGTCWGIEDTEKGNTGRKGQFTLDSRPAQLILIAGSLCLPHGASAQIEDTKATYTLETGVLDLPIINVGEKSYTASLKRVPLENQTGFGFELIAAEPTEVSSEKGPTFDRRSGLVVIPAVDLLDGGRAFNTVRAEMALIGGAPPLVFGVTEVMEGEDIFRHATFGDERLWTDELQMHQVISSSVSPLAALGVGLKVDANALPEGILETVDLEDPATTVALLELNAVVGLRGTVEDGELIRVGVTCALCHSDVDDSVMEGIGSRLDGYANRDLDSGAILALSPAFADEQSQAVLNSWGPGYYDPRFNQDGINHPVLIPPIYGLEGVALETYTGDGPISYWNAYVAVTQMGAQGNFSDPRLGISVAHSPDLLTSMLPALHGYQLSLEAPSPPDGSFDLSAAARGKRIFEGEANCSGCHAGPDFTDANIRLHTPAEVGMAPLTAERSATGLYRTTPLRALWQHPPYFHDGSAATLDDVVEHYDSHFSLGLTEIQKRELVEYLKSL